MELAPVVPRAGRQQKPHTDQSCTSTSTLSYIHHLHQALAVNMLRNALRPATLSRSLFSAQQSRFASSLVYLEHKGGKLNDSSLSAVTAAKKVDGNVR